MTLAIFGCDCNGIPEKVMQILYHIKSVYVILSHVTEIIIQCLSTCAISPARKAALSYSEIIL